jgi:hypothetical protein
MSGVKVKNATVVFQHYSNYNVKVMNITALRTTPYHYPGTSKSQAVFTESGPTGTQLGSHTYSSSSDYTRRRIEVPLNSQAVTELNGKLNSSSTYYTFGVGMYVKTIWPGRSSGSSHWYDVHLL